MELFRPRIPQGAKKRGPESILAKLSLGLWDQSPIPQRDSIQHLLVALWLKHTVPSSRLINDADTNGAASTTRMENLARSSSRTRHFQGQQSINRGSGGWRRR